MVLLDLASGTYFGLDPVGARLWQLVEQGKAISEVCNIMLDEYETCRDQLERDVGALVDQLIDKQLVSAT